MLIPVVIFFLIQIPILYNTNANTDSDTNASATFGQGLGNKFFFGGRFRCNWGIVTLESRCNNRVCHENQITYPMKWKPWISRGCSKGVLKPHNQAFPVASVQAKHDLLNLYADAIKDKGARYQGHPPKHPKAF